MKVHHGGHHQAYTDKLNAALATLKESHPELAALPVAQLIQRLPDVPEKVRGALRNNGGGYVNHELFWNVMGPNAGGAAGGAVGAAIAAAFGSFDGFKEAFSTAAATVFGSGWAWLVVDKANGNALKVVRARDVARRRATCQAAPRAMSGGAARAPAWPPLPRVHASLAAAPSCAR